MPFSSKTSSPENTYNGRLASVLRKPVFWICLFAVLGVSIFLVYRFREKIVASTWRPYRLDITLEDSVTKKGIPGIEITVNSASHECPEILAICSGCGGCPPIKRKTITAVTDKNGRAKARLPYAVYELSFEPPGYINYPQHERILDNYTTRGPVFPRGVIGQQLQGESQNPYYLTTKETIDSQHNSLRFQLTPLSALVVATESQALEIGKQCMRERGKSTSGSYVTIDRLGVYWSVSIGTKVPGGAYGTESIIDAISGKCVDRLP